MATTAITADPGYSFMEAETMGGDELRACSSAVLCRMLTDGLAAIEAETATWPDRKGRELRASKLLVRRAILAAERIQYYVGVKLTEASWWLPTD